jgi:dTDP-4-dehydrorhamnose 3,5-epimerase
MQPPYTEGQRRELRVEPRKIDRLQLIRLDVFEDDRGYLYEVIHANDPFVPCLGQVYVVGDPARGTVRAFHKHSTLHDWFCVASGSAKFAFVDDRPDSPTYRRTDLMVISGRRPTLIVVPPGVYHGWMSLEDHTIMLSVASHVYDRLAPDETRVPPQAFADLFGRDIWQVEAK